MKSKKVRFKNADGHMLVGVLDMPDDGEVKAYALFSHCFTCGKNIRSTVYLCRALTEEGIAVLRFDFTGLGESEGEFSDTNFTTNLNDIRAAADYLAQRHGPVRMLIGHSLGGTAAIVAAHQLDTVEAVVTIASPYEPDHIVHHFGGKRFEILNKGEAMVNIVGRPFKFKKQFLEDMAGLPMDQWIGELNRALLVFHGPLDDTVEIRNAAQIFDAARHPKSFISLDKADHLLTDPRDATYVGSVMAAWAHRYIGSL